MTFISSQIMTKDYYLLCKENSERRPNMASIIDIEGIGPANAEKLKGAGVRSTTALLKRGGDPKGRKELAYAINIEESKILKWVNHADLFRIRGIGSEYSELLEAAGVDTVPELRQRNAATLYETLVKTNQAKKLVRKLPTAEQVTEWVEQAKSLPRVIEY
jgi:predicted flap endonuclease-1-like 5' DNA nuclease